jgi:hypothetical protein
MIAGKGFREIHWALWRWSAERLEVSLLRSFAVVVRSRLIGASGFAFSGSSVTFLGDVT